ncbi:MAG: methionine synthase [Gammaproteobacteria bacterium]|nr:methionine synthase [Gammaproteobacteria bacterium]
MQRSSDRMLTTHVGSLARPHALLETMREKEAGRPYDHAHFEQQVRDAVAECVREQVKAGIDIVTDGEQGKVAFLNYVKDRLTGFEAANDEPIMPESWKKEVADFPDYYHGYFNKYSAAVSPLRVLVCRGEIRYEGQSALETDIANLRDALQEQSVVEAFLPSISPRGFGRNEFYPSDQDYYVAVGEAMREEYLGIVNAGFILQVDDPWLIEMLSDPTLEHAARRRDAAQHVEVLNHALRGIPEEKIRLHTCYGLNHGPRLNDIPMSEVVDFMLSINAGAYSFEVANPRHYHEWHLWETVKLAPGKILIPGLLGHATNYVEHPEMIADYAVNYAKLVGRENVIAGADCGFSSRASFAPEVHPTVALAKLAALSEGAALATKRLWK